MRLILAAILSLTQLTLEVVANGYSARGWQSEDGLPGNVVRSVVQSTDGFLWVASAEGIARFDGSEFEALEVPAELRLPRVGPSRLFATSGGVVWFSGHRVGLLRIVDGKVTQALPPDPSAKPDHVSQVVELAPDYVVVRRGDETWMVSTDPPQLLAPPTPKVAAALKKDLEDRARTGRILPDGYPEVLVDHHGNTWSNRDGSGIRVTTPDGRVLPIEKFGDPDTSSAASEFLEDREGNVWAASTISGLIRFRQLRAEVIGIEDGLRELAAIAVIGDSRGDLWFGNRSNGVDRMTGDTIEHFEFSPESSGHKRAVSVFYEDRSKKLWAAARDGSVFVWDGYSFMVAFPRAEHPSKVDAIYQDGELNHWFGGVNGLVKSSEGAIQLMGAEHGAPVGHVTCMAGDASDRLWFGMADGRVFHESDGRFHRIASSENLGNRRVSSLLVDHSRHVWATTLGAGLNFWNGERWHRFDKAQGLPDSRLTCLLVDNDDNFWLGSLGGIFRIPRAELLAYTHDPGTPLHWLKFDRSDGLPTTECSGASNPAGWRDESGRLYFPTSKGVARIDPAGIEVNHTAPPIYLKGVSANGVPLDISRDILTTGPGKTRLEFSYHGLGFTAPEKMSYRTRIKELDDTWREAGHQRVSTFEAVPPGRYHFEVVASNGDGVWTEPTTLAQLIVSPHFWQTPWFSLLAILSVVAIAVGTGWRIARTRMRHRLHEMRVKQALESERARISRDLHDDLGASLTEVSLLTALAAENPDETTLRPSLGVVSDKAKAVVETLDEIVWAATPSEDSLRSLVEYLYAWVRDFLSNVRISLRTDVIRTIPDIPLGPNRRHNVFLTAREAVNNAVKHSEATEIRLQICIEDNHLTIRIIDNGRGFDPEYAVGGHGLANLDSRMTACGGSCTLESRRGTGTTVTIRLPLPPVPPSSSSKKRLPHA